MDSHAKATELEVIDNVGAQRFEARIGDEVAVAAYERGDGVITFTHTEVPHSMEGKGIASALARAALDRARAEGLAVVPQCPFMATYIRRHPEYRDLLRSAS
jgi:predicted GNAT family acetyltransferase